MTTPATPPTFDEVYSDLDTNAVNVRRRKLNEATAKPYILYVYTHSLDPVPPDAPAKPNWAKTSVAEKAIARLKSYLKNNRFEFDEQEKFLNDLPSQCFEPGSVKKALSKAWSYKWTVLLVTALFGGGGVTGWYLKPAGTAQPAHVVSTEGQPTGDVVSKADFDAKVAEAASLKGELDKANTELVAATQTRDKATSAEAEARKQLLAKEQALDAATRALDKEKEFTTYARQVNEILVEANRLLRDGKTTAADNKQREIDKLKKPSN